MFALVQEGSAGRPHVAQVMVRRGYVGTVREAFDRFLAAGKPAYVAHRKVAPREACEIIRRAGGLAVVAHPGFHEDPERMIRELAGTGLLDGVECYYAEHSPEQTARFLGLCRELGLVAHGRVRLPRASRPGGDAGPAFRSLGGLGGALPPRGAVTPCLAAGRARSRRDFPPAAHAGRPGAGRRRGSRPVSASAWRRRRAIAVIAASLTLGAATWPRADAAVRPTVKIGVSLALTGPDARWGVPMLRGVELAVEDVNRGGGAGGHPLETVVLDSAGPGPRGHLALARDAQLRALRSPTRRWSPSSAPRRAARGARSRRS